jgi:hypothetical protein
LKKHFLVIWPTHRLDLLQVFLDLSEEFEFTFLAAVFPKDEPYLGNYSCRYWSEFVSAKAVLEEIAPQALLFMSIDSGLNMVLNYEAQRQGITTMILQHGIYTNYKDYRNREKIWGKREKINETKAAFEVKGFSTLQFAKRTFKGLANINILKIALYTKAVKRKGPYWAAKHLPFKIKKANVYLCFSPYNAKIHKETDRISEDQIRYIGSPELLKYLKQEAELNIGSFYLHLDQALAENSSGEETVSKEAMIAFYLKLNAYCKSQNARLFIKLHPETYHSNWLPSDDNIVYLRQIENLNQYIQSAEGCFGFYSTMVIPAIYRKPTILFEIQYSGLQEEIERMQAAQILNFWNFDVNDFKFQIHEQSDRIRSNFIQPDGLKSDSLLRFLSE